MVKVRLADSHGGTAFQRYLSRGPLAVLPLKGGQMASLVWSTTPEHAESLKVKTKNKNKKLGSGRSTRFLFFNPSRTGHTHM